MERADTLLYKRGLAPSRTLAQRLIAAGSVQYRNGGDWKTVGKPGHKFAQQVELRLTDRTALRYASRGGQKLEGALRHCELDTTGTVALDIGQSTGGFSDCLLQFGAARVVGIDSGHGQLAAALKSDPRIISLEGINARTLPVAELLAHTQGQGFELVVMDLSFISQTLVVPGLAPLLRARGSVLALVKPQFEVGPEHVGKGGIVRDERVYPGLRQRISECYRHSGFEVLDWFDSPITGGDGNREFFILARK